MIGRTLLHYRILAELGEGGMGIVYRAHDSKLGRDVALKLLSRKITAGSKARARFDIEARAAAALNHPNIATIHAIEEVDGDLFIVMEYVDGQELKDLIASRSLTAARSLEIGMQIATGLGAAHEKGIIHRDIKPSNIMVSADGKIKIMDFGLARIGAGTDLTETNTTMGTVAYMSPEQVRGESVDHRSDLWSLGVVLYELLGGRKPFLADQEQAVLYSIMNTEPKPLSSGSARLDKLVTKALAKNRDSRYQRAVDLAADLGSILDDIQKVGLAVAVQRPRLAVLPFSSIKVDPDAEFLGFALADQIIGTLTHVKGLLVRPSIAIRKYQHQSVDAPTAARDLQVEFVLSGHYLRQGDAMRLNVELVEAQSNEMVWRDSIQGESSNVFELQDRVAQKVLSGLEVHFSHDDQGRMRADVPANALAYEYYMRAVSYPITMEDNKLAYEMLQKSIALDPNYAPTYVELGFRINQLALDYPSLGLELTSVEEAYRKALSLNEDLMPAILQFSLHCTNVGRSDEAAELIHRMLRINPNEAMAHFALSYLYRYAGLLEESKREVEAALVLDPKNPRFRSGGLTYVFLGEYRRAHDIFALDPEGSMSIAWMGMTHYFMGETARALPYLDRAAEKEPDGYIGLRHSAISAHLKGDSLAGLKILAELEKRIPSVSDAEHWYLLATAYYILGDRAGSIRALEKAIAGGFWISSDPLFDPVRNDPEFDRVFALAMERRDAFKKKILSLSDPTATM